MNPSHDSSLRRLSRIVESSADLVNNILRNVDRLVEDVTWDSGRVAAESQELYRDLAAQAQAVRATVKSTPRVTRILSEAARLVAAYKLRGPSEALHRQAAARVTQACMELRGGVLKVGQFASARADLLPLSWIEALSRLQDQVPALGFDAIRRRVEEELGAPLAERFASFDEEPLAAASLAQVHGATLADGTRVAVKVQVPGVDELVEADLAALRFLASALRDALPQVDLVTIAGELSRAVREELDYRAEADHAEAFARMFDGSDEVVVPRVVRELSTGRVLVLERLDGQRLTEFLDGCEARGEAGACERDALCAKLVRATAAQILEHGRFQADAHPGNYLVLSDGRLGLLDFGCVMVLRPEARDAYRDLAGAILARDTEKMARLFSAMGFRAKTGDAGVLPEYAELILGAFREGIDLTTLDPSVQLAKIMEIARRHPVEIPRDFVQLGRVLTTLGGVVLRYRPRISLFETLLPYLVSNR